MRHFADQTAIAMPSLIYLAWGRPQRPRANLIQTLHTVEALDELGAQVRLCLPPLPRGFDLAGFLAGMGIRRPLDLHACPSLHRRWGGWPFALLHRGELRRADVVYTRVPQLSRVLARFGIAHWLEIHDTEPLAQAGRLAPLIALAAAGRIRGFVTVSAAGREALLAAGAAAGQVAVLPNGVDLTAFGSVPPLGVQDFVAPRALYVGRISRDRGLGLFERIAAAGTPVTLVGPRDHDPAPGSEGLRVEPAVAHARVPECYRPAQLALMPYQTDLAHATSISPIKLFEAMAAGRLVIASDLAPIRELVQDGVNGLLVAADDAAAWNAAIARVRADPAWALAMAEQGRRSVEAFSWRARAQRLLALTTPQRVAGSVFGSSS